MAAPTIADVNTKKGFNKTNLIDLPVQTFKSAPAIKPNPFTGLPLTGTYDQEHHVVATPPTTVLDATRTNPV